MGLTFQVAYTYSHELDSQSNDLGSVSDPFNIHYDYGSGALDRRQIFNVNYIYKFPFFANNGNAFERSRTWRLGALGYYIRTVRSPAIHQLQRR